jgi:mannose-6-phosphate isomerase-like protein (cupin superfamily)
MRAKEIVMSKPRPPIHIEPKGWGREIWIANNPLYCGKILEMQKGKRCSLHFHKIKTESFYLRSGLLLMTIKESPEGPTTQQFELQAGQCLDILPGLVHRMEALILPTDAAPNRKWKGSH